MNPRLNERFDGVVVQAHGDHAQDGGQASVVGHEVAPVVCGLRAAHQPGPFNGALRVQRYQAMVCKVLQVCHHYFFICAQRVHAWVPDVWVQVAKLGEHASLQCAIKFHGHPSRKVVDCGK